MSGHGAFGWMLVKQDAYHALLKEQQNAASAFKALKAEHDSLRHEFVNAGVALNEANEKITKAQAERNDLAAKLAKAEADLGALTLKQKQTNDDLLEARRLLWGVPDYMTETEVKLADWKRMGLPDPLEMPK
jgi:chromosome segregation ATPase